MRAARSSDPARTYPDVTSYGASPTQPGRRPRLFGRRGLQLADHKLFVTVCHRHLPTADREMNHRLSRQTRRQRPAAPGSHRPSGTCGVAEVFDGRDDGLCVEWSSRRCEQHRRRSGAHRGLASRNRVFRPRAGADGPREPWEGRGSAGDRQDDADGGNRDGRAGPAGRPEPGRGASGQGRLRSGRGGGLRRQVMAVRAAHVAARKTAEVRSAGRGSGRASPRPRRCGPRGGEDRGERPPGCRRRDHCDCWS